MLEENIIQLGAVAILFLICINKYFDSIKDKNGKNGISVIKGDIRVIKEQLDNHIDHITTELVQINANLKKNTDDTNEIKISVAVLKEKLDK